jgi:hypothetical protein
MALRFALEVALRCLGRLVERGRPVDGAVGLAAARVGLRGPDAVDGLAVRNRHHPAEWAAAPGVEPGAAPPDVEVGLLGDLLGLCAVPHDPEHETEDPRRGEVVEPGEGGLVPASGRSEEVTEIGPAVSRGGSTFPLGFASRGNR